MGSTEAWLHIKQTNLHRKLPCQGLELEISERSILTLGTTPGGATTVLAIISRKTPGDRLMHGMPTGCTGANLRGLFFCPSPQHGYLTRESGLRLCRVWGYLIVVDTTCTSTVVDQLLPDYRYTAFSRCCLGCCLLCRSAARLNLGDANPHYSRFPLRISLGVAIGCNCRRGILTLM